jgi:hypothetical protein
MLEKRIYLGDDNWKLKPLRQTVPYRILEGCEAKFVQLTNKKGVKLFWDKKSAKRSFNRQKKASFDKLGPKVLTDNIYPYGLTNDNAIYIQWGYLTEVVDTFSSLKDWLNYINSHVGYLDKLTKGLLKLRIGGFDLHFNNIGLLRNNLVCIDFGDESVKR